MFARFMTLVRALAELLLRPGLARFVSVLSLVAVGIVAFVVFTGDGTRAGTFGPALGGDYAQFYAVGVVQNQYGIARLYDLRLQDAVLHRAVPSIPPDMHLPYAHPPFVAPLFRPLARLPYRASFAVWLLISLACYLGALFLMFRVCAAIPVRDKETALWLALSWQPFAVECWLGGQLSTLGCLALAIALACERKGWELAAGLALALLLYKPTLLVVIVPLLVVRLRWRILAGFATGAGALAGLSALVAGPERCAEFVRLMIVYSRLGGSGIIGFRLEKYVDLTAFLRLLGVGPALARPLAIGLALPVLALLAVAWWRCGRDSRRDGDAARASSTCDFAWAATLCWMPVLGVYSPVYDTVVIVPGILLGADAVRQRHARWPLSFRLMLALLYVSAAFSPWVAQALGVQLLTLGLAALGAYFLCAALRRLTQKVPSSAAAYQV